MIISTNFKTIPEAGNDKYSYTAYLYEIGRRRSLTLDSLYKNNPKIVTKEETLKFCDIYSQGASRLFDDKNELIDKFSVIIDDLLAMQDEIECSSKNPFHRDYEKEARIEKSWFEELEDEDNYRRAKDLR